MVSTVHMNRHWEEMSGLDKEAKHVESMIFEVLSMSIFSRSFLKSEKGGV